MASKNTKYTKADLDSVEKAIYAGLNSWWLKLELEADRSVCACWEGTVRDTDYLSVSEIDGVDVAVFVSTVPGTEKVRIQVRHARRAEA